MSFERTLALYHLPSMMEAMATLLAPLAFLLWVQQPPEFEITYLKLQGRRQHTVTLDFTGNGKTDLLNISIDFDASPPARWFTFHPQNSNHKFSSTPTQMWSISRKAGALIFGDFLP